MMDTVCWRSCTSLSAAVRQMQKQEYPYRLDVSPVVSSTFSQVILTGLSICCVFISERRAPFCFCFLNQRFSIRSAIGAAHTLFLRDRCWVSPLSQPCHTSNCREHTGRPHVYVFSDFDQNMWLCVTARGLIICTFWPPAQIRAHKQSIAG